MPTARSREVRVPLSPNATLWIKHIGKTSGESGVSFKMVTYNRAHYVFRINGHFGANAATFRDFWSTGFRLGNIGADAPLGVDLSPFLESVAPAIETFHTDSASMVGTNTFLDELTIARVGHDGKYEPTTQETTRRKYATPRAGQFAGTQPWSSALVMSLRTGFPRGIASNGRTYWPCTALSIESATGRVNQGSVTAWVALAKTMIDSINTAAGNMISPLVRVGVFGADGKTGPARAGWVERIRVDLRADTIEKRENDEPPVWTEVALAAAP